MPGTRKLGRPTAHRMAMLRGLVTLLLENGQVETTLARAKEVRSLAEKMITLGKKNTLASRRAALAFITKEAVVTKVFNELAPKYAERQGGYTQIFKIGPRRGDAAEMAGHEGQIFRLLQLVIAEGGPQGEAVIFRQDMQGLIIFHGFLLSHAGRRQKHQNGAKQRKHTLHHFFLLSDHAFFQKQYTIFPAPAPLVPGRSFAQKASRKKEKARLS